VEDALKRYEAAQRSRCRRSYKGAEAIKHDPRQSQKNPTVVRGTQTRRRHVSQCHLEDNSGGTLALRIKDGKLTTHVLDTAHGCPYQYKPGTLVHRCQSGQKTLLKTILTNADGRTDAPLLMDAELTVGVYELVFKVGEYFVSRIR